MKASGIICADCGQAAPRRGNVQKYCLPCSEARDLARKSRWDKDHPRDSKRLAAWRAGRVSAIEKRGLTFNAAASRQRVGATEQFSADAGWMVCFSFPFSKAASKNHIWNYSPGSHVFKRRESNDYQNALALRAKETVRGKRIFQNKIWIDLFVQKPDHRSDAINVIDAVCDALKVGLGVDDRWFCIRQVDWEIVKTDPTIFISVFQRDTFDAQACSHCGRIRPFTDFAKSRSTKNGIGRACIDCRNTKQPIKPYQGGAQ